jgi:hypothetical protein
MPTHLVAAYVIFCLTPLGVALSVAARRRRVERALEKASVSEKNG